MFAHARALLPFFSLAVPFFLMLNISDAAGGRVSRSVQISPARQIDDIEYGRTDGISLRMDASLPASAEKTPAAIIVHGGGWVRGDRRLDVEPLFKPLNEAGFAWFSISYRLATDVTQFGVAIDDVETAVRYVKSHAAEYNVDPDRIALIGESAGGQLAAMAALRASPQDSVRAVVA